MAPVTIHEGRLRPIKNRVLVTDMNFESYKLKSGLIIPAMMVSFMESNQDGVKYLQ